MRCLNPINHFLKACAIAIILTMLSTHHAFAGQVNALYTTTVVRTPSLSRQAALKEAMRQALINISGNTQISSLPNLQDALDHAENWVDSYQTQTGIGPDGQPASLLRVRFNHPSLLKLLQDNQQGTWPAKRPLTLMLINTDNNLTTFLTSDDDDTVKLRLNWQMQLRHIPVIWPMQDLNTPTLPKHWPLTEQVVNTQLKHYQAKSLLAGRIKLSGSTYQANWFAWIDNSPWTWQDQADSEDALLQHAVDHLTNLLANSSANTAYNGPSDITATVEQVSNLSQYAQVINQLTKLPGVSKVSILESQANSVTLKIISTDSIDALKKVLQQHIKKMPTLILNDTDDTTDNTTLSLRWQTSPPTTSGSTTTTSTTPEITAPSSQP